MCKLPMTMGPSASLNSSPCLFPPTSLNSSFSYTIYKLCMTMGPSPSLNSLISYSICNLVMTMGPSPCLNSSPCFLLYGLSNGFWKKIHTQPNSSSSLQLHGSIAVAHRFTPNPTCNALINCYSQIPGPTLRIIQSCALDSASKLTILPWNRTSSPSQTSS